MPSAMSPPSTTIAHPYTPFSADLDDDSNIESEILDNLCKKTLVDVDEVTLSMRACISGCHSTLNQRFFWSIGSDSEEEVEALVDSFVPETEFGVEALDASVLEASLPEYGFLDSDLFESTVPETEFGVEADDLIVPDSEIQELEGSVPLCCIRQTKKRKVSGGGYGGLTSEPAPLKAVEMEDCVEEMMRILLPAYFTMPKCD